MFSKHRSLWLVVATLALAACGSNSVVSAPALSTTTTTVTTTTIAQVTTTSTIPTPASTSTSSTTTTPAPSTTGESTEDVSFTSTAGGCDFDHQPAPAPLGATLKIAKIGLEVPLLHGLTVEMSSPSLCEGSALPGTKGGVSIIGGHRTSHGGYLRRIDELEAGDSIEISFNGKNFTYQVTGSEKLFPDQAGQLVSGASSSALLKIFACDPPGKSTQRIVVTAVAVLVSTK
jgi:LPXTG-site transpeptidase (sortase) family protein